MLGAVDSRATPGTSSSPLTALLYGQVEPGLAPWQEPAGVVSEGHARRASGPAPRCAGSLLLPPDQTDQPDHGVRLSEERVGESWCQVRDPSFFQADRLDHAREYTPPLDGGGRVLERK